MRQSRGHKSVCVFSFSQANVSVHRRRLVRRTVERLVGFHFHWLFLASLSEIVAGTVDALSIDGVEGPLNVR